MSTIQELGLKIGVHERGPRNHILDVPGGLGISHKSFNDHESDTCTGFTVLQPCAELNRRCAAAIHALNGAGELTGTHSINEWGYFDTPIVLTNTPSVGRAYDGVSEWMMRQLPALGESESVVIPIVGECDDGVLHNPRKHVWGQADLIQALDAALLMAQGTAPIALTALEQGAVGGGSGMISFELKAGIGSASRRVLVGKLRFTVGVLLQTNFGGRNQLTILGKNLGPELSQPLPKSHREGSCIGILATDAPLGPHGLKRLAQRMGLGLARTGSHAHHGSGEIFLAYSTARDPGFAMSWDREEWNPLLQAAVEAAEEAVYNSLVCAQAVTNMRASVAALKPDDLAGLSRH